MSKPTKEEIVQELQLRNIDFDGGATLKDLSGLLAESQARDTEVNAPGSTVNEDEGKPVVQPLETVKQKVPVLKGERCWNCYAQDRKTKNRLDANGECSECGFQKELIYNTELEAQKAKARIEEGQFA